jgi:hypothetical protein
MATSIGPAELARLCLRKTRDDIVDRDVVLSSLWLLHRRAAPGVGAEAAFSARHLGEESRLRPYDYRLALDELATQGYVMRDVRGRVALTVKGHRRVRELVDTDRAPGRDAA